MSTNKQDGKGPHQESVPPLTTPAKIVGNDVLPQAGSDLHEEIAKRRRETPEANEQRQGVSSSGSALLSESSNSGPAPLQDDSGSLLSHEDIIGLRAALKAEQAKRAKILAQRGNQNNRLAPE